MKTCLAACPVRRHAHPYVSHHATVKQHRRAIRGDETGLSDWALHRVEHHPRKGDPEGSLRGKLKHVPFGVLRMFGGKAKSASSSSNLLGGLMTLHSTTRVPVDDKYAALVGKAVYVFAYYEWTIVHIIECLECGFVSNYSRGKQLGSADVRCKLQKEINKLSSSFRNVSVSDLQKVCDDFEKLIVKRNALIHAHPITDADGSQILAYQTMVTKPLPDMRWPKEEVELILAAFDAAACQAGSVLGRLRQRAGA